MCEEDGLLVVMCEAHLTEVVDNTYARFPELRDYVPASTCCRGCKVQDIAADLGRPAARAWENLYWLGLL